MYSAPSGGELLKVHSATELTTKHVCLEAARNINLNGGRVRARCKFVIPDNRVTKL